MKKKGVEEGTCPNLKIHSYHRSRLILVSSSRISASWARLLPELRGSRPAHARAMPRGTDPQTHRDYTGLAGGT